MTAHPLDYPDAFLDRRAQVLGALHLVTLEQVVRADFRFQQAVA